MKMRGLKTYQSLHQSPAEASDLLQVAVDVEDSILLTQFDVCVYSDVDS